MNDHIKSKVFLLVFSVTAGLLAWSVWFNYRPQVIYASCVDIADRTQLIEARANLEIDDQNFDYLLNNCLQDAGYFGK